ncbi:unnamed protein product, partial [Menidia menidia]
TLKDSNFWSDKTVVGEIQGVQLVAQEQGKARLEVWDWRVREAGAQGRRGVDWSAEEQESREVRTPTWSGLNGDELAEDEHALPGGKALINGTALLKYHQGMFTLTEVASLNDIQPTYRILKPWWDVFMDYLGIVMLMLAIFSGTMQLTKDQVVCLPIMEQTTERVSNFLETQSPEPIDDLWKKESAIGEEAAPLMAKRPPDSMTHSLSSTQSPAFGQPQPKGVKTKLDFQQYVFVNQMCYHVALPWYSKYFPYLALIHTIVLMVSSNFWFKYPKTSSKIEHFVSILGKCFESPWTTKALSETACEDSEENKQRLAGVSSLLKHLSTSSEEGTPNQSAPVLTKSGVAFSAEKLVSEVPSMTILDKKDGEQAKALFEKVRKFRAHVEDSDLIYKLYAIQTVIKTVKFILILCYTMTFVASIDFDHVCEPEIKHLTGYAKFHCTHNMAFMLKKLLVSYIALICVYGIICIYTLFWLFRRPLKEYSFEKVREESSFSDIPDVKNDFAFLLHMVDQYDQLYSKRFGVFLSEVSENKLREISLNHEWTFEKLRQHITRNPQDKLELHLFMLSGVPDAVFDLTDLEILKLELIPEARITAKISQMINLHELHFYHCPAKVEQTAFIFLCDHLRCLHVKFTDVAEIPSWVYLLKNLRELYLVGNLNSENNKLIGLESLRDLRHLKILHLKSNLTKIPTNITDLSPHLIRLVIHNDGTKLLVLNSLKKMMNLAELELHNCELERIPHAIFSLNNLQELDLKSNNIRTIEEVISFQHLKRLVCLKLWYNKIITIPLSISHVKNLESLYLSHNKLETLPSPLFTLLKLRYLDVSHNSIVVIPLEIGFLQNLQHFAITANKIEAVPKQMFKCSKLRTLCLGHNCISFIPDKIGNLSQLTHLELKGNCLDRLPSQLGQSILLRRSCLVVEDHLFESLPVEVKERTVAAIESVVEEVVISLRRLRDAAELKHDESILMHIWDKDCVAVEARLDTLECMVDPQWLDAVTISVPKSRYLSETLGSSNEIFGIFRRRRRLDYGCQEITLFDDKVSRFDPSRQAEAHLLRVARTTMLEPGSNMALYAESCSSLSQVDRHKLATLLWSYRDIFSVSPTDLGRSSRHTGWLGISRLRAMNEHPRDKRSLEAGVRRGGSPVHAAVHGRGCRSRRRAVNGTEQARMIESRCQVHAVLNTEVFLTLKTPLQLVELVVRKGCPCFASATGPGEQRLLLMLRRQRQTLWLAVVMVVMLKGVLHHMRISGVLHGQCL